MNRLTQIIEKLKTRWDVETIGGILLILFIFSITGMTALYVRKFMFNWLGITDKDPFWVKGVAWFFTVFPSYQVLFLLYGFLLGKFNFVWNFEKKNLRKLKALLTRSGS